MREQTNQTNLFSLLEDPELFATALNEGADPNSKQDGMPILIAACYLNSSKIAKLLLTQKHININAENENSDTAFTIAAKLGKTDIIQVLLNMPSINIDKENNQGKNALQLSEPHPNTNAIIGNFSFWYDWLVIDLRHQILAYLDPLAFITLSLIGKKTNKESTSYMKTHRDLLKGILKPEDKHPRPMEFLYRFHFKTAKNGISSNGSTILNDNWRELLFGFASSKAKPKDLDFLLDHPNPLDFRDASTFIHKIFANRGDYAYCDFSLYYKTLLLEGGLNLFGKGDNTLKRILDYRAYQCFTAIVKINIWIVTYITHPAASKNENHEYGPKRTSIFCQNDFFHPLLLELLKHDHSDYFLEELSNLIFQHSNHQDLWGLLILTLDQKRPNILKMAFNNLSSERARRIQDSFTKNLMLIQKISSRYPITDDNLKRLSDVRALLMDKDFLSDPDNIQLLQELSTQLTETLRSLPRDNIESDKKTSSLSM